LAAAAVLLAGARGEGLGLPLATMGKGWPRGRGWLAAVSLIRAR
jgi:hypothetical protein